MPAVSFQHSTIYEKQPQTADGIAPEMSQNEQITRIRVMYTKGASLRFTGHLDLQRLWERLLRRSRLPVRYSEGYHPRARLNLASALPLGFISQAELLDFWMDTLLPIAEIQEKLIKSATPGLDIKTVQTVDLSEDALQTQMHASEYKVTFFDTQDSEELERKIQTVLDQKEIIRRRRKKTYDLRPLILKLEVTELPDEGPGLIMHLLAEPGTTGRPDEVLDELGYPNTAYLVTRTKLILRE
jgi:radical SAM-linked protein